MNNVRTMTTREVARALNCSSKTVRRNAHKCMPDKIIENGKQTFWTESELTVLLEFMKAHNNRIDLPVQPVVQAAQTTMTPGFKAQMYIQAIEKAHRDYESFLEECNKTLECRNQELLEDLGREKSYRSIKSVEMETGRHFGYAELRNYSKENGYEIHKAFDQNYGTVNTYHIDVWFAVYGLEL